jgi:putative transposase
MKRSRFSEEQIIALLREQEAGARTADVCRKHGVSTATFYKWGDVLQAYGPPRLQAVS